jgi:A/G-specific adenine glycosylase
MAEKDLSRNTPGPDQGRSPAALRRALLTWYVAHRRDLPWRQTGDPYRIWISEIMLQQTRVAAVLEHYRGFVEAFPTLEALAEATEAQVLARWSGLGYYRRARMMHRAAQLLVAEHGGRLPAELDKLRSLPGVGRYTAAAIASISFGLPEAVVDGNVERVLGRLDGRAYPERALWQRAGELLDAAQPGEWNQAMMELGATVCTPRAPQCGLCPLRRWCLLPGEGAPRRQPRRRKVQMARAFILRSGRVYLTQREDDEPKMAGMWELPEFCGEGRELARLRHSITDTNYEVRVLAAHAGALAAAQRRRGRWVARDELAAIPLTGLARKALRKLLGLPGGSNR